MDADSSATTTADAIVVLGCRVEANGVLSGAAARRCHAAAKAYRRSVAELIIASGGRRWGNQVEALCLRQRLIELGVPSGAIWVELCSLTTAENAVYCAALLRSMVTARRPRAAIATSSWHLGRALANFERVGVDTIAVAADDPPPTLLQRARRRAHETISMRLDKVTLEREGKLGSAFLPVVDSPTARAFERGRR